MCVIIYKPEGTTIDVNTLWQAYEANPDGIGIAYREKDQVHAEKGISFESVCEWSARDLELLIHFRYATHGVVSDAMAHPFPVTAHEKSLHYVSFSFNGDVLMHNGIISNYGNAEESDTMEFTRDCLAYLKTHKDRVKLLKTINSKFALISPQKISLIGGFEEYMGCQYSNTYFMHRYGLDMVNDREDMLDMPLSYWDDRELEDFYNYNTKGKHYDYTSTYKNRGNRKFN